MSKSRKGKSRKGISLEDHLLCLYGQMNCLSQQDRSTRNLYLREINFSIDSVEQPDDTLETICKAFIGEINMAEKYRDIHEPLAKKHYDKLLSYFRGETK